MARIEAGYRQQLEANPDQEVSVIIRTAGDATVHAAQVSALGLRVTQYFSLVPGLAVTGPAAAVLRLVDENWVSSIEPDQPVHTMGN